MASPSSSGAPPSSPWRPNSTAVSNAFAAFYQQAEDDDVVCAFGPDYFRGATLGAGVGSVLTASLCWYSLRLLKADQREVDFLAGLRRGQRNRHFSSWTLLRGLRTQPMLTVGCLALGATSMMKCVKCYLANRRCREFYQDDVEFAKLQAQRGSDPNAAALLAEMEKKTEAELLSVSPLSMKVAAMAEKRKTPAPASPPPVVTPAAPATSTKPAASLQSLLNANDKSKNPGGVTALIHRCPTFWDGVAVAFLGSVMDCYLPQKPVQKYYSMHVGLW